METARIGANEIKQIGIGLIRVRVNATGKQTPIFGVGTIVDLLSGKADEAEWTGNQYPPAVGERVVANFNGFGPGVVTGYRAVDGYLAIEITVDKQPEWHLKQNGVKRDIIAFGPEVKY